MRKFTKKVYAFDAVACIFLVLLLFAASVIYVAVSKADGENKYVRILLDTQEISVLPLSKDSEEIAVGGVIIKIEKGKAYIADSDCPDKVCTKMHGVDQNGGGAVCLPNRVVLEPAKHSDGIDYIIG